MRWDRRNAEFTLQSELYVPIKASTSNDDEEEVVGSGCGCPAAIALMCGVG